MDGSGGGSYNPFQIAYVIYDSNTYAKWANPYSQYVEVWGMYNQAAAKITLNQIKITETNGSHVLTLSGMSLTVNTNDPNGLNFSHFQSQFTGNDEIHGSNYHDILLGYAGNDMIAPYGGGDIIDGGAGIDTVILTGKRGDYFTHIKGGTTYIVDNTGRQGEMKAYNVERVQFTDGTYTVGDVASSSTTAQIHSISRLYLAALDRLPDDAGLDNWMRASNGGMSLEEIANGFVSSNEFAVRYGQNLSDAAFINQLYVNVLDRTPDQAGHNGWMQYLAAGNNRAEALIGFSESAESIANYKDDVLEPQVGRLYLAALNRMPDPDGSRGWVNYLNDGHKLGDIAAGFVNSGEFKNLYGNPGNTNFVKLLYNNVLHRAPDDGGLATWTNALDHGMTRADALAEFSKSPEFVAQTDYLWA
jgi:hypothetical protein